jgi:hypothetical protein
MRKHTKNILIRDLSSDDSDKLNVICKEFGFNTYTKACLFVVRRYMELIEEKESYRKLSASLYDDHSKLLNTVSSLSEFLPGNYDIDTVVNNAGVPVNKPTLKSPTSIRKDDFYPLRKVKITG